MTKSSTSMTKHTYFRADDGALFFPETAPIVMGGKAVPSVNYAVNNAEAFKACQQYEQKLK